MDALKLRRDQLDRDGAPVIRSRRWNEKGQREFVPEESAKTATDVVLVLHGIRDRGAWSSKVRASLERASKVTNKIVEQSAPRFGYFSMLLFILGLRNRYISWFARAYTNILIDFPNVKRIHFWGHSYGTYVFANALAEYESIRVHNVVLAGSVLPRQFPWADFQRRQRVGDICNIVADTDFIVAVFPGVMARIRDVTGDTRTRRCIGDAGFVGFEEPRANHFELVAISGGHGAFLKDTYLEPGAEFILGGPTQAFKALSSSGLTRVKAWVSRLNQLTVFVWIGLIALLVLICAAAGLVPWLLSGAETPLTFDDWSLSTSLTVAAFIFLFLLFW